jgi:uncharacterized membrane protein
MTGSSDTSALRSLHRLIEHYTPHGMLGRVLLGGTALGLAPFLIMGSWAILSGGAILPLMVMSLFTLVAGIAAFPLGVVVLWPVYLSLIGNIDAPGAYSDVSSGARPDARGRRMETPEAVLKRRYAVGELSREEFERRLDGVMETGQQDRRPEADDAHLETSQSR